MKCLAALLENNFPYLLNEFTTYEYRNARLILELSEEGHVAFPSDFLLVAYVWLPSAPPGPPIIRVLPLENTLAEQFITDRHSAENIFASGVALTTIVSGSPVQETRAVISRVRYPDGHHPITDQVYQLLANEADEVFGTSSVSQGMRTGGIRFEAHKAVPIIARRMGH